MSNVFKIVYEKGFYKDLKSFDKQQARLILAWIKKNLDGYDNSKERGKILTGNLKGYWRYCIGYYLLICEIKDDLLILICVAVGHRKDVYK